MTIYYIVVFAGAAAIAKAVLRLVEWIEKDDRKERTK